jgi:hypothetical protein
MALANIIWKMKPQDVQGPQPSQSGCGDERVDCGLDSSEICEKSAVACEGSSVGKSRPQVAQTLGQ